MIPCIDPLFSHVENFEPSEWDHEHYGIDNYHQDTLLTPVNYLNSFSYEDSHLGVDELQFLLDDTELRNVVTNDCFLTANPEVIQANISSVAYDDDFSQDMTLVRLSDINYKPYTPDYDHCYSVPASKVPCNETDKSNFFSSHCPDSASETSSEDEVDVVTVEEYQSPVEPRVQAPRRNTQLRRGPRKATKMQNAVSARSLKAAIKKGRITNIRRGYRRRGNNSVETSPSSSVPSSAHCSRSNSDAEDAGKRENHNCSERKRREVQRSALQNLRVCIPDLESNPKAPKVQILSCATIYIKHLKENHQKLKLLKQKEIQKQRDFIAKYKSLTS